MNLNLIEMNLNLIQMNSNLMIQSKWILFSEI